MLAPPAHSYHTPDDLSLSQSCMIVNRSMVAAEVNEIEEEKDRQLRTKGIFYC